jgi:Mg-chelatase subunit ChlD
LDAVNAVNSFLNLLSQTGHEERVGLASYSDKSKEEVKLTPVYSEIQAALALHTNSFQGGSTNIGDGILTGAKIMADKKTARPWATRVLIVLTDGIHNTGTDPIYAAYQAASEKILIYTITFSTEADVERMKQVAEIGSGKHFHATNGTELTEAFEEIAKSLPTLITF